METGQHNVHGSNIINVHQNSNAGAIANVINITVNPQQTGILTEFIAYMNTLSFEKQVKIMQFALKQKDQ